VNKVCIVIVAGIGFRELSRWFNMFLVYNRRLFQGLRAAVMAPSQNSFPTTLYSTHNFTGFHYYSCMYSGPSHFPSPYMTATVCLMHCVFSRLKCYNHFQPAGEGIVQSHVQLALLRITMKTPYTCVIIK